MPDLLLELLSEEIPARMQARAADDLKRLVTDGLVAAGLVYEGAAAYATPRRLALQVVGIPARSPDTREERKGPRVGAPQAAIDGFLKSAGLLSIEQATVQSDGKKGSFYVAAVERPGRPAIDVLAALLPQVIRSFPWPKSMRWGAQSAPAGTPWSAADAKGSASLRWVRPLQGILATFGPETEDPDVVPFAVDGIAAGDTTVGHRFHAPGRFAVKRFDDYVAKLEKARVVLDPERRKRMILADARNLALAQGLDLVEDPGLLDEVAGLVEWPVVLLGRFEERFLAVPAEVIRATIRANQKCFVLRGADGQLENRFVLVANLEASDGGAVITAGNERVVRARLSDARYFWETDQGPLPDYGTAGNSDRPLDQRLAKLRALNIVFHEKLGTQGERIDRIAALAREIAPLVGADPDKAARAAELAKADLVSEVVGEFPETQGLMGRRYAELQGEDADVAAAIEEHYKPVGPTDRVPTNPVSVAVALADKIDTLVGFWAIDEKPTGSKDPYALRRAALGVIRLVLENRVRLAVLPVTEGVWKRLPLALAFHSRTVNGREVPEALFDLIAFFHDRMKVQLREQGARHDLLEAVLSEGSANAGSDPDGIRTTASANDDLLLIVRRVEALGRFLQTEDGAALLAGFKRAANILRIEEKKDGRVYDGAADAALLGLPEEKALARALDAAVSQAHDRVAAEDFEGAMGALAELRPAVDAFFDKILVNDPDPALRQSRLELLARFRAATRTVADFSRIAG